VQTANLAVFFLTSILLALTPGPDNLFVLTQSLAYGRRPGLIIVLGLCTGLIIHTALVAFGIAAIIAASPMVFKLLKLIGAGYLLFLAWGFWQIHRVQKAENKQSHLTALQLYRRGFIMNVTNPKVGIFFLAFLPQFVQPQTEGAALQIIVLGLLFMLSTMLVFGGIAILAGYYSQFFSASSQKKNILNRFISLLFVVIALNLLLSN